MTAKKRGSKGKGAAKPWNGNFKNVKSDLQQTISSKVEPTVIIQNRELLKNK